ncbi:MAG TPA: exosortase A [Chakrabartia sp.]|nr:exosortase A [Chakrabartia sp.]
MTMVLTPPAPRPIDWQAPWARHLTALGFTIVALLALFARDAGDMASIWWNVSTYTHCLFIIPITLWLISQRMEEIQGIQPSIWLPGLAGVALGGLVWMLGEAAGIALFRHAALVLMIQSAIATLIGRQMLAALLFPIFYLSFLVPFGEELVPLLQTITAKMCMILLAVTGVPASVDGVFITTPAGLFEVAEACSGVKFLVAMAAYATLAANVCFKSWTRRLIFLAFGLIVPVLANGVRAFGTIWISEKTGIEFAASFDHVIYGWFFFGFVMIVIMAASWKFFDRNLSDPWLSGEVPAAAPSSRIASPAIAAGLVLVVALASVGWQAGMSSLGRTPVNHLVTMPEVKGWSRTDPQSSYPWVPRFDGADHRLTGQFINASGQRVDMVIAIYGWQEDGREMVGFGQGTFDPESEWSWTRATLAPTGGKADVIFAPGAEREVAAFYVMGGTSTGSETRVKLATLKSRLTGGDQAGVAILVSAQAWPGQPTRPAIDAFLRDLGALEPLAARLVDQARGQ